MNWMSIVGLSMITIGGILSFLGTYYSGAETQERLESRISKKDAEIDKITANSNKILDQNSKLMTSNEKLVKQNEEAKKALEEQKFENSFIARLSELNQHVASIKAIKYTKVYTGNGLEVKEIKETVLIGLKSFEVYNELIYDDTPYPPISSYKTAQHRYVYTPNHNAPFETYYISLATLLNFTEDSDLSQEQKIAYFERVIDPMDFFQKKALIYHIALSGQNKYDFDLKRIEKKYQFLKDLYKQERIAHSYNHNLLFHAGIYSEKPRPHNFPE
jgi:hypothetical protein